MLLRNINEIRYDVILMIKLILNKFVSWIIMLSSTKVIYYKNCCDVNLLVIFADYIEYESLHIWII